MNSKKIRWIVIRKNIRSIRGVLWESSKSHQTSKGHMSEYAWDLEIAQNSNCLVSRDHMFFPWDGSLFSALRSWDSSIWAQVELSQDLRAEKSEPSQEKSTWSIFQAQIELSQDLRAEKVSHLREKHVIMRN